MGGGIGTLTFTLTSTCARAVRGTKTAANRNNVRIIARLILRPF
jgi:hypothetical protein